MPIQQPPPVCKRAPENLPISPAFPPLVLQAAVHYEPDEFASDPEAYQAIIDITWNPTAESWMGFQQAGTTTGIMEFHFTKSTGTWWATVIISKPGAPVDFADFGPQPYNGGEPFQTQLAKAKTHPDGAALTLKIMA